MLDDDGTAPYNSDFGTLYTTSHDVRIYMVGRGATFFQSIIGGIATARQNAPATHKKFVECRNNRVRCTLANNDAGCKNSDYCLENQPQ